MWQTRDGRTPLFDAASQGSNDICNLLLGKGADAQTKDVDGISPLILASQEGHLETVTLLLSKGAAATDKRAVSACLLFLLMGWCLRTGFQR